ncbi:hypothetical protein M413DRAFT_393869 [Hebeloma cylindrosporum]|uniref:Phytocyanin domain-containing protein n=1 Tax=Hebeloma cylindrosporum TaxID=76867 RepID=A0A0C3CFS2_HEBCY|nr:hypothetical protein M413DRAFT_393869 [Hebeloma cylindrosporum h7]
MRFFTTFVASASVLASVVSAAQHNVVVGQGNANVFEPKFLEGVAAGDTISFKFVSKNHTVTQSTFPAPCVAKPDGVNSGFIPVDPTAATQPEWTIQIDNVTAPLWFYCAQGAHCKAGMVFAINPTPEKTFDAFLVRTLFHFFYSARTSLLTSSIIRLRLKALPHPRTPVLVPAPKHPGVAQVLPAPPRLTTPRLASQHRS